MEGEATMTLDEIKAELANVTKAGPDDAEWSAGMVLLASAMLGANEEAISQFTGVPLAEVQTFGIRLRANGVWGYDGQVATAEWFAEEVGGVAFCLDVAVAMGFVERTGS